MTRISKADADKVLSDSGWLARQPEPFREDVLRRSNLQKHAAGSVIYHAGDPQGGIYGLVTGTVSFRAAPTVDTPRLIHLGEPGNWTGEAGFLTRQPRRLTLSAITDVWLAHLPLDAMDQMAARDPEAIRHFAQIMIGTLDTLVRVVSDLQKPDASRRIASVLVRMGWADRKTIPLSQAELGGMANASRKQVNAALQKFAAAGWVSNSYRAVTLEDVRALRHHSVGDADGEPV